MKLYNLYENKFKSVVSVVYNSHGDVLLGIATHKDDRFKKWCFPGGGIKKNEPPKEAAARECREETGIIVKPYSKTVELKPGVAFVACKQIGGTLKPNSEFSTLKWIPLSKLPDLINLHYNVIDVVSNPLLQRF